ncbi:MAG: TRAP transporter small permease [Spirochaetes bacterium]|nr:TRAP transporter small permease [Spirochaetota bacterium]
MQPKGIHRLAAGLNSIIEYICGILLGIMTLTVLVGVVFRYVFLSPLGWTEELSRYLMIWTASLAISVGIYRGEHIGLTFVPDRIKGKVPTFVLALSIDLFVFGFLIVLLYFSIPMVQQGNLQIAQSLPITMVLPTLSIPVSMFLALVQLAIKIFLSCTGKSVAFEEKTHVDI